jgi:hypothetical protein
MNNSFEKMKILIITLANFLFIAATAQNYISQERTVGLFKSIKVRSGIDLYLSQGNETKMTVSCLKDKIDNVIAKVNGDTLEIYFEGYSSSGLDWDNWPSNQVPKVNLTFKNINKLEALEGSNVFSEGQLVFENFEVMVNRRGNLRLDLKAKNLKCETQSGSEAILIGTATNFEGVAKGRSKLNAKGLLTQSCWVTSSGTSNAYVFVENHLSAKAKSGSNVYYYGNPSNVNKQYRFLSGVHPKN